MNNFNTQLSVFKHLTDRFAGNRNSSERTDHDVMFVRTTVYVRRCNTRLLELYQLLNVISNGRKRDKENADILNRAVMFLIAYISCPQMQ